LILRGIKIKKNIWLLSAYRSDSHAAWADWLVANFKQFNWSKVELSGRHFRWRIRGNPLSWLNKLPENNPDLILATSMVDLATLKGLNPRLVNIPCLYYFHENQFAYPISKHQLESIEPKMVQLYGALSADLCFFNSAFNQSSFLQGVDNLLNKLPDEVPPHIVELLAQKSQVLPVVIQPIKQTQEKNKKLILWNHRWEYDKAPEIFYQALLILKERKIEFQLALLGSRHIQKSPALQQIETELDPYILYNAKVSKTDYQKILSQSALVVSTAIHEFQGLSMLEAVSAGAVPVVPNDLCYQEQYPEFYRYPAGDYGALADKLEAFLSKEIIPPVVDAWYNSDIIKNWQKTLNLL